MNLTPQQIAERCAAAMWANDDASRSLDMTLDTIDQGSAQFSMPVTRRHTNGHDICHGGFIFTLADTAFAFACNSYNQVAVAQQNSITFVNPGKLGDRLIAACTEVSRSGRSGIYDTAVHNQDGTLIALFRGHSRTLKGQLFDPAKG